MSDSRVPPAQVVSQVARVVSSSEHTAGFHRLLGDADIDRLEEQHVIVLDRSSTLYKHVFCSFSSIIIKVKQHDEFFPAFHALITDVLHTLGKQLAFSSI